MVEATRKDELNQELTGNSCCHICDENIGDSDRDRDVQVAMSLLTLSRTTIPTAIFAILASFALWKSHAPYKKRQRIRQTVSSFSILFRSHSDRTAIIISFPTISPPGGSLEILMRQKSKSG